MKSVGFFKALKLRAFDMKVFFQDNEANAPYLVDKTVLILRFSEGSDELELYQCEDVSTNVKDWTIYGVICYWYHDDDQGYWQKTKGGPDGTSQFLLLDLAKYGTTWTMLPNSSIIPALNVVKRKDGLQRNT